MAQKTPGLGIEYEVHVPAYFALLLNTNPDIEDFKLRSNVPEFGNLDDLLIDIKTKGGENLYFAFQLKHKEDSKKNLLPTNFEAKGDFNLEKYCKAFNTLSEENRKKYHFILYTNKNFDSSHTNKVKNFCIKGTQDVCSFGKNFDTSDTTNSLYKFEVKETQEGKKENKNEVEETQEGKNENKMDYVEFFSKFSVYTGQANARDLEKSILKIFNFLNYEECYAKYINFFRKWHRGDFTDCNKKVLDKKTLNVHLVDILLSSVAINYHFSGGQDENLFFFEKMVQKFDITIIDAYKKKIVKLLEENVYKYPEGLNKQEDVLRLAQDNKFIDRFSNELANETKLKLLHYYFQKPLILDFNTKSKDQIYEASKLCKLQETGIKLVIMGKDIDVSKFSHLKIFTNLTEVDGNFLEETKKRCKLSLQGRNISFGEIFEDEIREFVTPKEIFQMLKGSFTIGEDKENLPECYIPRTVSTTVFDIESIIKHSPRSNAIIFYYKDKFEELRVLIQNIVNRHGYLFEDSLDAVILRKQKASKNQLYQDKSRDFFPEVIIIRREECSRKQFDEILKKIRKEELSKKEILKEKSRNEVYSNDRLDDISMELKEKDIPKDVHLFQVVDEKRCLLLLSTKNIFYNQNYKSTKISVEENNINVFFNNSVNILCAQPGMGKSTLVKYLKNKCDPNFWTVLVDLKTHNQFLTRNHKADDVLVYFLELKNCHDIFFKIKKMFLENRKIVLFLDGLDEVENECVHYVLNITRELSEMGFRIWLSSRQNLQQKIELFFKVFTIEIDEINENQQRKYIKERLAFQYNENEIEEILKNIFNNTDLANNCQILEIPLQLHIITQNFLDNKSYYLSLSENNFILTKMFEVFFEGKYKHHLAKVKVENPHLLGGLDVKLKYYEIVALHSVLDDEHFQKLQIGKLLQDSDCQDCLGIITGKNSENKAVFEHLTFAEYFASKFLVKNFDKARILKEEIFSEKYQNLFLIFNIMLAQDIPLHLAIIYKDFSRIHQEIGESSLIDKGGRNFLQVAACVATRHPPLDCSHVVRFGLNHCLPKKLISLKFTECLVKDHSVELFKGENSKIKEIVNHVLLGEPFMKDEIFEWNSLDYALAAGALYIVEVILEKCGKFSNFYMMLGKYYNDEVVAYYSIRFGYHCLLSEILAKKSCRVTKIFSDYLREESRNNSILNFIFTSDCTNRTRFVELLAGDDVNKIVSHEDGFNFFHFAIFHEDIELVKFLLGKRADVDIKDKDGWSPLLWAVKRNNLEISKLLVENEADVNIQDTDGRSPLFLAIERNHFEISKLLIENGADANSKSVYGWSLLRLAVEKNNFEVSKLLVENGADVNIMDIYGWSPLCLAVERNNLEISKLLVENGANANIKTKYGWSLLQLAVNQNNLEISKLLVENGADVNIQDTEGRSPLCLAVNRNNLEISKLLVENGADVNIQDTEGRSPLCLAVNRNNLEISKLLVENGADINVRDKHERSPLFYAAKRNKPEILKVLLKREITVNSEMKDALYSLLPEK